MLPARPNVVWRLFVLDQLVGTLVERAFGTGRLTPREFAVLSTIGATRPITPTDLAQLLGMPATTLSAVLKRFERDGLVVRTRNPEDGRSVLLEPTPEGERRIQEALPAIRTAIDAVGANLDVPLEDVQAALEAYERAARRALDGSAKT
jgi:DNA-binding MarR family transcriptional regulator